MSVTRYTRRYYILHMKQYGNGKSTYYSVNNMCYRQYLYLFQYKTRSGSIMNNRLNPGGYKHWHKAVQRWTTLQHTKLILVNSISLNGVHNIKVTYTVIQVHVHVHVDETTTCIHTCTCV